MSSPNGEIVPLREDSKAAAKRQRKPHSRHTIARDQQAWDLRVGGATLQQIADQLGWADPSGVQKAIERFQQKIKIPEAEQMRMLHVERLEQLYLVANVSARQRNWEAMREARELLKQQAKLLGLEVTKIEHTGRAGGPLEIEVVADVRSFSALVASLVADGGIAAGDAEAAANSLLSASANGEAGSVSPELPA